MSSPRIPSAHEVETFSGQYVDTRRPRPETIKLVDIAHALGNLCRYGGHCQEFYPVAQHAVFVSRRVERRGGSLLDQLAALHHDDSEAYLMDIPRPMKPLLGKVYKQLTLRMDLAIIAALGLPDWNAPEVHVRVKDADNWALFVEAKHLLPSQGRHWWEGGQAADSWGLPPQPSRIVTPDYWLGGLPPKEAKMLYLARHAELTQED